MAQHKTKKTVGSPGKGKMTVVMFQLEGSDETLQQGFEAIKHGFDSIANSTPVLPAAARSAPTVLPPSVGNGNVDHDHEDANLEPVEVYETSDNDNGSRARRNRTYRTPKIVDDLNPNAGSPTFEEFYDSHGSPTAQEKRYLLALAWLKNQQEIEPVTADHVFTLFQAMKWQAPPDMAQPFRTMKRKGWVKSDGRASFALHHLGVNAVQKMETN